jgi:hypothetical protein
MRMRRDARLMQAHAAAARTAAVHLRARLHAQGERLAQYQRHRSLPALAFLEPLFVAESDRRTVLAAAVDAAVAPTGADMGNVQLRDPVREVLQIEAHRGFAPPFLAFFAGGHDGQAACGLAWQRAVPVTVAEVAESLIFLGTLALAVMLDAGARAARVTGEGASALVDTGERRVGGATQPSHVFRVG